MDMIKFGAKRCKCGVNISEKMDMCSACHVKHLIECLQNCETELADRTEEMFKVRNILNALVKEPYGCPQCHSGKIIREGNDHWPDCPYNLAVPYLDALKEVK